MPQSVPPDRPGRESRPHGLKQRRGIPDPEKMSASHFILLIEADSSRTAPLVAQLIRLGVEPIRVSDLAEAVEMIQSRQYAISAVLLPAELPGGELARSLRRMRLREPVLPCMAYGKAPDQAQRERLRQAGVLLSLWDGYDLGMLRFQLNRLVSGENHHPLRGTRRVPMHTPVRVQVGDREKDGLLYSLSENGCFIETPRASMDGARLRLIFSLEAQQLEIDGVVAFANVPGNLQRPNLPLGMGVRFTNVLEPHRESLARFIDGRLNDLEV